MAKTETTTPDAQTHIGCGSLYTHGRPGAGRRLADSRSRPPDPEDAGYAACCSWFAVVAMFSFGLAMEGKVYKPNTGDLLDILGFIGDSGLWRALHSGADL